MLKIYLVKFIFTQLTFIYKIYSHLKQINVIRPIKFVCSPFGVREQHQTINYTNISLKKMGLTIAYISLFLNIVIKPTPTRAGRKIVHI